MKTKICSWIGEGLVCTIKLREQYTNCIQWDITCGNDGNFFQSYCQFAKNQWRISWNKNQILQKQNLPHNKNFSTHKWRKNLNIIAWNNIKSVFENWLGGRFKLMLSKSLNFKEHDSQRILLKRISIFWG